MNQPKKKVGKNVFNPLKIEEDSFVNLGEVIKHPPIAVSIGTHNYKGIDYPTPFGSYGDISCIVGASKSKKTFFKSAIMAGYIGGNSISFSIHILYIVR